MYYFIDCRVVRRAYTYLLIMSLWPKRDVIHAIIFIFMSADAMRSTVLVLILISVFVRFFCFDVALILCRFASFAHIVIKV